MRTLCSGAMLAAAIVIGCGSGARVEPDAGAMDAGDPFEDFIAIDAQIFDCRADEPADRRSATPAACFFDSACDSPLVVGHRGTGGLFALYAPENSLSAVRLAILLGADAVEVDVRHTADDQLVLMHDGDLTRTTGNDGVVAEMTLAQVTAVELDHDGFAGDFACESVPKFSDVLALAKDRIALILDTKTHRGDLVAHALAEADMLDQAVISVSNPAIAVAARDAVPGVKVQIRPDTVEEYETMRAMFERPVEIIEIPLEQAPNFVAIADGIDAKLFADVFDIDADVYLQGDVSHYDDIYASGVTIAQTEFPFWLLERLGRRTWSTLPPHRPQIVDSPLLQ